MDEYGHNDMTSEYSSVDDILAEYKAERREAAVQELYQSYLDAPHEEPRTEDGLMDEEGVRLYRPGKAAAPKRAADEAAREYVPGRRFAPEPPEGGDTYAGPERGEEYEASYEAGYGAEYSAGYDAGYSAEYDAGYARESGYEAGEAPGDEPGYSLDEILNDPYSVPGSQPRQGRRSRPPAADESGEDEALSEDDLPAGDTLRRDDFEVDPRFNLSGRREARKWRFDAPDTSPEEGYEPPGGEDAPRQWAEYEALPGPDRDGIAPSVAYRRDKKHKKEKSRKRKKRAASPAEAPLPMDGAAYDGDGDSHSYHELGSDGSEYAPPKDYSYDREQEESAYKDTDSFPSFREYLAGLVTGLLFRARGGNARPVADTAPDEDEKELGPEVSAEAAYKYYGSFVHSLRLRLRICLVLLFFMAWTALGLPQPGMLKTLPVQAAMSLLMQLTVMLLCLDVVTGAAVNMARGRFGADSLAVLACVLTSFDALAVALGAFGSPHTPFCLLSSLSLAGVLLSSLLSARGLRKALRVPAIAKRICAVTSEAGLKDGELTLLKSLRSCEGYVRRTEEAPPDEELYYRAAPLLLIAVFLLSLVVCLAKKSWSEFLFVFTALLSPAAPAAALLGFALPFFVGSNRIFSSGAGIAGWSGLLDLGRCKNLIVTDRDLFPEGSVKLGRCVTIDDAPEEKIVSYAGTMIVASGSGIACCFEELMKKYKGSMRHVENFEYLSGGGMRGIIDGETVLCGGSDLMRLMNVPLPFRYVEKTSVLLAINGKLYGIFNLEYTAQPQVRKALVSLMRSNRHPVFALRDFNVTPEMLHNCFDLATDGYDFPPYVERFAISEARPAAGSKIAAVVCREGLGPLTHMADTGRSMYVATRVNLLVTLLSALTGVLAVFLRFLTAGQVSAGFLLAFALLWLLPVLLVSFFLKF